METLVRVPCVIQLCDRHKIDASCRIVARQLHVLEKDIIVKTIRAFVLVSCAASSLWNIKTQYH